MIDICQYVTLQRHGLSYLSDCRASNCSMGLTVVTSRKRPEPFLFRRLMSLFSAMRIMLLSLWLCSS